MSQMATGTRNDTWKIGRCVKAVFSLVRHIVIDEQYSTYMYT